MKIGWPTVFIVALIGVAVLQLRGGFGGR